MNRPNSLAWADPLVEALFTAFPEAKRAVWSPLGEPASGWCKLSIKIPGPPGVEVAYAFTDVGFKARIALYSCTKDNVRWHEDEGIEFDPQEESLNEMMAWLSVARDTWQNKYTPQYMVHLVLAHDIKLKLKDAEHTLRTGTSAAVLSMKDKHAVWFLQDPWSDPTKPIPKVATFGVMNTLGLQNLAKATKVDTRMPEEMKKRLEQAELLRSTRIEQQAARQREQIDAARRKKELEDQRRAASDELVRIFGYPDHDVY